MDLINYFQVGDCCFCCVPCELKTELNLLLSGIKNNIFRYKMQFGLVKLSGQVQENIVGRNKTVIFTFGFARGMNRDDHTKKSLYHLSEICTWHFSAAILSQQKTGSFFMQQLFSLSLSPVFLFVFSVTAANPLFPSGACLWRCVQHYFSPSTGQLHFLLRALQKQSAAG